MAPLFDLYVQGSNRLLAQIDEPIDGGDHDRAADDIADRHRQQIAEEEIVPGERGKIAGGLADRMSRTNPARRP